MVNWFFTKRRNLLTNPGTYSQSNIKINQHEKEVSDYGPRHCSCGHYTKRLLLWKIALPSLSSLSLLIYGSTQLCVFNPITPSCEEQGPAGVLAGFAACVPSVVADSAASVAVVEQAGQYSYCGLCWFVNYD